MCTRTRNVYMYTYVYMYGTKGFRLVSEVSGWRRMPKPFLIFLCLGVGTPRYKHSITFLNVMQQPMNSSANPSQIQKTKRPKDHLRQSQFQVVACCPQNSSLIKSMQFSIFPIIFHSCPIFFLHQRRPFHPNRGPGHGAGRGTQQIFTAEDWASPLTLGVKSVVLLVAAPVALTVFFVPYGLYAGWVGEMG